MKFGKAKQMDMLDSLPYELPIFVTLADKAIQSEALLQQIDQ